MVINDVKYFQINKVLTGDLVKNFSISNNTADFSVNPGFLTTSENFSLEVQNLQDNSITINEEVINSSGNLVPDKNSVTLSSGAKEKIYFSVFNQSNSSLNTIKLSTGNLEYSLPVYVFSTTQKSFGKNFALEPAIINFTMATNSNQESIIYLKNTGGSDISNVSITISDSLLPYVSISQNELDNLYKNSTKKIYLNFSSGEDSKKVEGQIVASTGNELFSYIPVYLNFLPDYIPSSGNSSSGSNESGNLPQYSQTCSQLGGNICKSNEECSANVVYASDSVCCLSACAPVKTSSTGKLFGWIIIFFVLVFVIWFYLKKYKGEKRVVNLLNFRKKSI